MINYNRSLVLGCLVLMGGCGDSSGDKPPDAAAGDATHVTITDGEVIGSIVGTSRQFLGIPYAKPPVGPLRWMPPQKPDPWTSPLQAAGFGKRCAQVANATLQNAASEDEDCLYLNVWTPSPAPASQNALPVMLWIHGGGNVNGSANEPVPFSPPPAPLFYTGEFLAENHGVVVVSINYRLGVLGFFSHPALAAEGSLGNQGLLDQRLAMQWVHDNIARFGGDPGNVTIFGESAGALDVCLHVASPGSSELFHRAISESGGCTTRQPTRAEAEVQGTAFASASPVGCAGGDAATLACLRGKSVAALLAASSQVASARFAPSVDGQFLPGQPRTLYDTGQIAHVPYLLGSNTDEGTLFTIGSSPTTPAQYHAALVARLGGEARANEVEAKYPLASFANAMPDPASAAFARVVGDSTLVCTTYDSAVRAAKAGSSVYMYNFDIPTPVALPGVYLGATHGSELTSVFGTSPTFAADAPTKAASDLIQRYWTNFARTGDPNAGSDPVWPKLTDTQNTRVNLALQATVANDFRRDECEFWRAGYALQF